MSDCLQGGCAGEVVDVEGDGVDELRDHGSLVLGVGPGQRAVGLLQQGVGRVRGVGGAAGQPRQGQGTRGARCRGLWVVVVDEHETIGSERERERERERQGATERERKQQRERKEKEIKEEMGRKKKRAGKQEKYTHSDG